MNGLLREALTPHGFRQLPGYREQISRFGDPLNALTNSSLSLHRIVSLLSEGLPGYSSTIATARTGAAVVPTHWIGKTDTVNPVGRVI